MTDERRHDQEMVRRYGLLPGQYRAMLAQQDGRCFTCGGFPSPSRRLALDHDHVTGEPRGLLCDGCNGFLARAEIYLGRRDPSGIWPLPPGPGLWVNGELWTWRTNPDLYDRDMSYAPWNPRWHLEPPWRLQPEPKRVAEERRASERRWEQAHADLARKLAGDASVPVRRHRPGVGGGDPGSDGEQPVEGT